MKKLKVLVLVTMLTMMLAVPATAHQVDVYEEGDLVKSVVFRVGAKEYVVNDAERHQMKVAPFIYDGRTFVPVRYLGRALGVPDEQIKWDGATKTATLTRGQFTIALTIGSKTALRNGIEYYMGVSPQITEGRTQLPARFVAEGLGYNVTWCGERRIVIVYTGDTVPEVTKLPPYVVTFQDANLKAAIQRALRIPAEDVITKEDMLRLTRLGASDREITNLSGLEYAVNLTRLYLTRNQITDISPLAGLTNLRELYLWDNQITDITPLAGLTNLRILHLGSLHLGNQITDVTPLAGLTNLIDLDLGNNQITDITPLAGLTNLERLHLNDNQITDITTLAGLTNLERLHLSDNQITDITPLAELTNLDSLSLSRNQITDITPLVNNPGLGRYDDIYLVNNPLDSQGIQDVETLRVHGVFVRFERYW